ncbi:MAG TPA: endopeptidase La [Cytophagaceae bacterium]|jgi:ATP-dependent Lon protease|nr:endopeptidase La [Cytophagaceae bacterium]
MNRNKNQDPQIIISSFLGEDSEEFIPLLTAEDEEGMNKDTVPEILPLLPVRNTVLFPGVVLPITVGREKSIKLVKKAYRGDKIIGVVAQENAKLEEPGVDDIYKIGTVAKILKMLVLPDGNTTIIIQGQRRFKVEQILDSDPFFTAKIEVLTEDFSDLDKKESKALLQTLRDSAQKILKLNPDIPQEANIALTNIESPSFLTHFLASNLNADVSDKQSILEVNKGSDRITRLLQLMDKDIQMLKLKQEIHSKVHSDINQEQRDYYLRQQIKVMQEELGQESHDKEIDKLREKGKQKRWVENVAKHFEKELKKLERSNPSSPEYATTMNYVELMLELPWGETTKDNFDLKHAKKILDEDHFGLEKVKARIIEYLAVLKLKDNMKSPILCLYGPPGVGKTSLGKSIAKALDRKYVRVALGGLHDEAEVRGHRKTYIGAMPGRIIQGIKKAQTSNPVFVLDEIDKVGVDYKGDPSSALLEVLDPEQNTHFQDNYLEVEYDLSKILFIATANRLDTIQPALLDRMEIIEISGYTMEEKAEIAKKYLIPKQKSEHGIKVKDVNISQKALVKIIEGYTRESGVRALERKIAAVIRYVAKSIVLEEEYPKTIEPGHLFQILGAEDFDKEIYSNEEMAGVVPGLAWTSVGGELLYIEAGLNRGHGKLSISGKLGEVMKESATAALSYLRSISDSLNIDHKIFDQFDLHIHVPAGAVPKDGPSAGITMLTSLASVFTQRKVKQKLAMTGEITLKGKVLPVGGIKEKILAAKRAGIKEIVLCKKNKKDIDDIPASYLDGLQFHYVETADEVLKIALLKEKVKAPMDLSIREEKKNAK